MAVTGVTLSFRVSDADGEVFSMPLYGTADLTKTLSQLNGEASNIATLLDAILDGKIVSAGLCIDIDLSGATIKANPAAGSEIERTGLLPFKYGAPMRTWSADMPAFAYSKFVTGTNNMNMTDAAVLAFISAIESGTHITFTDPSKQLPLYATGAGSKTFRKHRRQTKRT